MRIWTRVNLVQHSDPLIVIVALFEYLGTVTREGTVAALASDSGLSGQPASAHPIDVPVVNPLLRVDQSHPTVKLI